MQGKVINKADILKKQSTEILKLTYQHLDGMVSKLPNGQKETYVTVLLEKLKPNAIHHILLNDEMNPRVTDEDDEGNYECETGETMDI